MANVIEVLLRTKDQTAGGINKLKSNISGLKVAIGGLVASFALGSLIRNIEEAEAATAQLDSAFKATGRTLGLSRSALDGLASEMQRTTTYGDDLVKQGEAILLTFDRVRGEAFERTIRVAGDLSARLGTDLTGSIRQVGRALQDPEQGLTLLRRAGIQFNDEQTKLIKGFAETGQTAQAQNLILAELERRYKGAAAAARNTLGGAIKGLKNDFGDLFEGTQESTSGAASAINSLSEVLTNPGLKKGIDGLASGLAGVASIAATVASVLGPVIGFLGEAIQQAGDLGSIIDNKLFGRQLPESAFKRLYGVDPRGTGPAQRYSRKGKKPQAEPVSQLTEVSTTARAIADEVPQFLRQMSDATETEIERQVSAYHNLKETLVALRSEGLITRDQQEARLSEGLDNLLPEFDLEKIRGLKKEVKVELTEIGEIMKGVWQGVGHSIQSTLSDAIYDSKLSLRSLVDVARRAFADIASALITSNISKLIGGLFSGGGTAGSVATYGGAFLGGLGFAAGGGRQRGPRIVGEDGPELDMGSGRIYNRRQLAFAGMGGNVTYAPVTNVQIIEKDNPDQMKREIFQAVAVRNAQQQQEFIRTLQRSGVELKG